MVRFRYLEAGKRPEEGSEQGVGVLLIAVQAETRELLAVWDDAKIFHLIQRITRHWPVHWSTHTFNKTV